MVRTAFGGAMRAIRARAAKTFENRLFVRRIVRLGDAVFAVYVVALGVAYAMDLDILESLSGVSAMHENWALGDLALLFLLLIVGLVWFSTRRSLKLLEEVRRRRALEARLTVALQRLHRANHARAMFLASMSHELRTPLNAIVGFGGCLTRNIYGTLDERQRTAVEAICESASHLEELVSDLLDLGRIDAGDLRTDVREAEMGAVVAGVLRDMREAARAKAIELSFAGEGQEEMRCHIDPDNFRRAMAKVLSNALKYTPPEGRVEVRLESDVDGFGTVAVADTGIGMSPARIQAALEPLGRETEDRTDPYVRPEGGGGTGLPVAKSLIELQGGRIRIDSEPGLGTTVRISVPLACPSGRDMPAGRPEVPDAGFDRGRVAAACA